MLKVFVYEFTCAADIRTYPGAGQLRREGRAMLAAVVEDLARLDDVTIESLFFRHLDIVLPPEARTHFYDGAEKEIFQQLAASADYSLIIAPESDGLLLERCHWVQESGGRLLGSMTNTIDLAADKLRLSRHLAQRNIRTPATELWSSKSPFHVERLPAVIKPRRGAGCLNAYLIRDPDQLRQLAVEAIQDDMLVQDFVAGQPASVSFLVGTPEPVPLLPTLQHLRTDGKFQYLGGEIPLEAGIGARAVGLGRQAIEAIPGFLGYVGVDLVLGQASDGSQDYVIEVNPRLTTSYIGLRRLAENNLAEGMIQCAAGGPILEITWRPGRVHFSANGVVDLR